MSNFENFNRLFNKLKSAPPAELSKHFQTVVESYLFLEKAEQKAFAETFYKWYEEQVVLKSFQLSYSKLLVAFSLFFSEQYDKALPLLAETQNLFTDQNNPDFAAICMTFRGSIFRTIGDVDLALKSSWSAYEQLSKSEKFPFFHIACEVNIGGIYFDRKHYDQAIPHYKTALEMAEKTENYYWLIYSLHGLGKIYLIQKKYPEAKEYLERAMIAAEKFNNPHSISNSLSELGNYYFTTGDYAEAEQYQKRSLALREQTLFLGGVITNCICLGEIYIRKFKPDDAIAILEKGLKLAEQIKVKPKMYRIQFLLSEIYQRKNDPVKSLFHYKLYHELREQVEMEDNERKIKNAQLIFEAEQTLKENIIIKKQKEEIEKKNIELQETIDELTRTKIGKKARAITLAIAIVLFILEDFILHFALIVAGDSYLLSLIVKMVIIFSLSPINKAIESRLLKKVIKKKRKEVLLVTNEKLSVNNQLIN